MSDDPTRDLNSRDDERPTVELPDRYRDRRAGTGPAAGGGGPADETQVIPDDLAHGWAGGETRVIPDDLVPGQGGPPPAGHGYGLNDTQPISLEDRLPWRGRPPARPRRAGERRGQPPEAARRWGRPDEPAPAGWGQPAAPAQPGWSPLPEAGGRQGPAAGARPRGGRQHLFVWVFTLLIALGLGSALVLGPAAAPLGLSPQASALLVVVVSLAIWVLLSPLLRLAGIVAFLAAPLLLVAGGVPELRRLPLDLPQVDAATTLFAMALGLSGWLAGHWFFYARKGWWRSRVARAILGAIPGVEASHREPE